MYSLLGFGLKRACTSLQAVCMIMVYFTEHLNQLLCFFDQESWLIRAAYFTYIYSWGKLCNHKCPHSFICLESFSHEKRISNSFNRRFCLSVRMQPATSATPFLLFFAGLHVRWHHFCEYLASNNFISFLVLFSCYLISSLMVFWILGVPVCWVGSLWSSCTGRGHTWSKQLQDVGLYRFFHI